MSGFDMSFYKGKKVLITGHTGFKGSWMCRVLSMFGADVTGYALEPSQPSLFAAMGADSLTKSFIGDVRDREKLIAFVKDFRPEIIFHLAAQPIVREGYKDPVCTYETNVMGTVNLCEAVRLCGSVRSFVNVTTDKVYKPDKSKRVFAETDPLDGFDPYSNSKSCSELVTSSYSNSFFKDIGIAVSTCRAGNAIGGGDFSMDRLIPDCFRAVSKGDTIIIRNPDSIRPFQHVLDAVCAYLMLGAAQYENGSLSGSYNIAPHEKDCVTAGQLADMFCKHWGGSASWKHVPEKGSLHEEECLLLDCSKIRDALGWSPRFDTEEAIRRTVEWYRCFFDGGDTLSVMDNQIGEYFRN
ncbi:MAG: CDP-glucose 4,6-dehydratase [Oscillospiraceae bacterium]|nr:CDP-glucose 4,6-dehydratase [Oscillospiraceae bacterium]